MLNRIKRIFKKPASDATKQRVITELAEKYKISTFVETGTYKGNMVAAIENKFEQIYSIELDQALYEAANDRFKNCAYISISHGCSSEKLADIVAKIQSPTLFWLDGHFSGGITAKGLYDTPIIAEILTLLSSPDLGHIVMIDDARLFGTDEAYPTIQEITALFIQQRPDYKVTVKNDAIILTPY